MAFTEEQKQQAIELFKKIATKKAYHKEYMKIYRQKLLEQGTTQKCYNKKPNNTKICNNQYHKHTAFMSIKNLFKGDEQYYGFKNGFIICIYYLSLKDLSNYYIIENYYNIVKIIFSFQCIE